MHSSRSGPPRVEPLECRRLLTTVVDLRAVELALLTPTELQAGADAAVSSRITVGVSGAQGAVVEYSIYLSADTVLSSEDVLSVTGTVYAPPGGQTVTAFEAIRTTDLPPGVFYPILRVRPAVTDAQRDFVDSDGSDDVVVGAAITLRDATPPPDYVPHLQGVIADPQPLQSDRGAWLNLTAVYDEGTPYRIPTSFYLSADDVAGNDDDVLLAVAMSQTRPPTNASSAIADVRIPADVPPGSYRLFAVAPNAAACFAPATFPVDRLTTDLTLASVAGPDAAPAGSRFPVDVVALINVTGSGDLTTPVLVGYALSSDDVAGNADDIPLTAEPVGDALFLTARGTQSLQTNVFLPSSIPPGAYHLVATINPHGNYMETTTANNSVVGPRFDVLPSDFVYANLSDRRAIRVARGGASRTTVTLKNASTSALSRDYKLSFYLSSDPTLSSTDRLFSRTRIRATLPAKKNKLLPLNYTVPRSVPMGTRFLIIAADRIGGAAGGKSRPLAAADRVRYVAKIDVVSEAAADGPFLIGSVVSAEPLDDGNARVRLAVTNAGKGGFTGPARVTLVTDASHPTILFILERDLSLRPGESTTLTFDDTADIPGPYNVFFG